MKNVFTHYTSFGVSISPSCADSQGFLKIREDLMAYVEKMDSLINYCGACQSKVEVFKDSSSINTCSQQ